MTVQRLPTTTALMLCDIQKGILRLPVAPHAAEHVANNAGLMAAAFRSARRPVVIVTMGFARDFADVVHHEADAPIVMPANLDAEWFEVADQLAVAPTDIWVVKRQWDGFHDSGLNLHLRRRGITHLVFAGFATSIGVDTTARSAYSHGYSSYFVEDAMSDPYADSHAHTYKRIFPLLGRVTTTAAILTALNI
ncbi:MAG: isochorismatase family protein [Steroidobacteraceae bacterium]